MRRLIVAIALGLACEFLIANWDAGLITGAIRATRAASAGWQEEHFAHFFGVPPGDVREVRGYRTPPGVEVTHVLVGRRWEASTRQLVPGLVLMRCTEKECRGDRVFLHPIGATIHVLGVVDLRAPGPLGGQVPTTPRSIPPRSGEWIELARSGQAPRRWAWPALVVALAEETSMTTESRYAGRVTGTHRHTVLALFSLRGGDERARRILAEPTVDLYPSGVGATTAYRLVAGGDDRARGPLDIIATEQRHIDHKSHCLRPPPTEFRLRFDPTSGRYERRAKDPWMEPGCR